MAEPLLATLAERGERLVVAALPWVAPAFAAMPEVEETIELPFAHGRLDWKARRRTAGELRGRFDVAYVLPNSLKSALVPWLARIPERVGYRGEGRPWLVNRTLPNVPGRPPMVAYYGALADAVRRGARAASRARTGADRRRPGSRRPAAQRLLELRAGRRTVRPSAGRARTTRSWRVRCTPLTARRSPCSALPASVRCAKRSPPKRPAPAAFSPAEHRCSMRWR